MRQLKSGWPGERHFPDMVGEVKVRADLMRWPDQGSASQPGFGGNQAYNNLGRKTWHQVYRAMQLEDAIFNRFVPTSSFQKFMRLQNQISRAVAVCDELDLGVASAVYAISAGGGIPVSSCNGGSFGGTHSEPHPVVAFNWPVSQLKIARDCAREAGVSMWVHRHGELVIGADYIGRMLLFADALYRRRAELMPNTSISNANLNSQPECDHTCSF